MFVTFFNVPQLTGKKEVIPSDCTNWKKMTRKDKIVESQVQP